MDHDLLQVGSPRAVTFRESFRVNLFEGFIVILDALVERSQMRLSRTVDRASFGHGFLHRKTGDQGGSRSQGGLKGQEVCQGGQGRPFGPLAGLAPARKAVSPGAIEREAD